MAPILGSFPGLALSLSTKVEAGSERTLWVDIRWKLETSVSEVHRVCQSFPGAVVISITVFLGDLGISMSLSQSSRAAMLVIPSSPVWKQIFH